MRALLDIRNLKTSFSTHKGTIRAVDGVSLSLLEGETIGVVGESGCGKTMLALSILRLIPSNGTITEGQVIFNGVDLLTLTDEDIRLKRGSDIAMIFQEPMTSLNPVLRIGDQISEAIRLHKNLSRSEALALSIENLRQVGIVGPEKRIMDYPHQLSGGMRQRVMIAMAMSCQPKLLLADEPTTALDVTIQAQILDLIADLQQKSKMAVMLITHDLGVVSQITQKVAVMYAGRVVENAKTSVLFENAMHPYTLGLMASQPGACQADTTETEYLKTITGTVPSLYALPSGCRFRDRCPDAFARCVDEEPSLMRVGDDHFVACWKVAQHV